MSAPQEFIRPAKLKDADEITGIYNRHVEIGGATFDTQPRQVEHTRQQLAAEPPDGWYVAAHSPSDARLLGWAAVQKFSARFGYRHTCESAIYLAPDAVGRGIADQLQSEIESHCRRHQIHHAVARIISNNERSLAFHRRWGYQIVGVQREVGHMDGHWVDVTILQRIFDSVDE